MGGSKTDNLLFGGIRLNISVIGSGRVELIASPERCYTDLAAKITRSEKSICELVAEPNNPALVRKIVENGHLAATEFDLYIFGVEGYSRVCEAQLIRKRMASYMIKSGRVDKSGKRSFDIIIPPSLGRATVNYQGKELTTFDIIDILELWYNNGVKNGIPEEDLRYLKPEGTEFKAIVAMNAHSLLDWFKIRCCMNAQEEIRDMANKMLKLCKEDNPVLFETAGASCVSLGYCPENGLQNKNCHRPTHKDVLKMLYVDKKD